jgi:hypothetical protein
LANNETYFIVKEKVGYVIKKGLNESTSEYIDQLKNRKFYPSYSQALKRLNLITKEVSSIEGYEHNISLFESDDEKRFYLSLEEQPTQPAQQQPAPQPVQQPAPQPSTDVPPTPMSPEDEMGDDEMPETDVEMDTEETPEDEEQITFKVLQKYTGKLAQKVRQFLQNEENQLSSEDMLYILNSVISALPVDSLETEDKEKVISKFEGGDETEYELEFDDEEGQMGEKSMGGMEDESMGGMEGEEQMTPPATPTEMGESLPMGKDMRNMRERQRFSKESLYSESTIDKVLSNYFIQKNDNKTYGKVQKISESYEQESSANKFLNKYPKAKLLGKTSKGNLVFEMYDEKFYISPNGKIA